MHNDGFSRHTLNNAIDINGAICFHKKIENFNPELYGYKWAVDDAPRIRLVPMACRGHIEAIPVRALFN
ncbi:MAG: hypothetical protein M0P14_01455 [Alkaliphilus sp.]|nr:hypothetical protein [Alkaliphilus sp.]